ncbi:MAG TPA: glycosyltransferase family A protein [Thermoanaerobaculia bacterium]|nr:glycosyltransferase family A protein [Thermoanaerobaculia bacterium]
MRLVSCLLPTRDRPHFLRQALRCYARQTYPNRELLVLDGGEHDVADLCRGIDGVRHLRLSPDMTYGACMNVGAEHARGEILQKLDDDDHYAPSFIARAVEALENHGLHDLVVGWDCFHVLVRGDPELRFSGHGWAADGTLCIARSLWERVRFRETPGEFESVLKDRSGAKLIQVCAPELYILFRHGRNSWQSLRGVGVDDYFLSLPPTGLTAEHLLDPDDAHFYASFDGGNGAT